MSSPPPTRLAREAPLLATLADRNFVEPAKQLFASAFHHGAWPGDYLLLAHDLSKAETAWFSQRGISVHPCPALVEGTVGGLPPVLTSKLHLFGPDFRSRPAIVYLDSDSIVQRPIGALSEVDGFASVVDWNPVLRLQMASRRELERRGAPPQAGEHARRLRSSYDLNAPAFCAGFFAFRPGALEADTFERLLEAILRLREVSRFGDQLALNLHFHRRWQALPGSSNLLLHGAQAPWPVRRRDWAQARILHLTGPAKPWLPDSPHHPEWSRNRVCADATDFHLPPVAVADSSDGAGARRLERRLDLGHVLRRHLALRHRIP